MNRYHYEYRLIDHAADEREWVEFDCWDPPTRPLATIAERAAENFHADGGWERTWPLVFDVREKNRPERCERFVIELEEVPSFIARRVSR